MKDLLERAQAINSDIISHRRYLHQNPELGLELPGTYEYVCSQLTAMGYVPERIGAYGIVATAGGKQPGKTFLIRADMDALPIPEETDLPFRSENGCMHACGHDCHTAMLLGAAKLLKEREDEIQGVVKLFFQTGEEIFEGAKEAIEDGLLEKHHIDAAMMIHILSGLPIPAGTVAALADGPCYASADWYQVDVKGKGGHGAMPHTTVNTINILGAINAGIQEIMAVKVPRSSHSVMTVGQIHSGDTSNIIPETGFLAGTIRTFDEEIRADIKGALVKMSENVAAAREGSASVRFLNSTPVAMNDKAVRGEITDVLKDMLGPEQILDLSVFQGGAMGRVSGSEDFAYIAQKVPSGIFLLAAGTPEEGFCHAAHNPKTDFKEAVLYVGAAAYAASAMGWLGKNQEK